MFHVDLARKLFQVFVGSTLWFRSLHVRSRIQEGWQNLLLARGLRLLRLARVFRTLKRFKANEAG